MNDKRDETQAMPQAEEPAADETAPRGGAYAMGTAPTVDAEPEQAPPAPMAQSGAPVFPSVAAEIAAHTAQAAADIGRFDGALGPEPSPKPWGTTPSIPWQPPQRTPWGAAADGAPPEAHTEEEEESSSEGGENAPKEANPHLQWPPPPAPEKR
ncbi:MAG: hypothetical protein AAGA56_22875 [Myxococcota bacterium]